MEMKRKRERQKESRLVREKVGLKGVRGGRDFLGKEMGRRHCGAKEAGDLGGRKEVRQLGGKRDGRYGGRGHAVWR